MKNSWRNALLKLPNLIDIDEGWKISEAVLVYNTKTRSIGIGYYQLYYGDIVWIVNDYRTDFINITYWQPLELPND